MALRPEGHTLTTSFLGARYSADSGAVTFRVRAPAATRMDVWVYTAAVAAEPARRAIMSGPSDGLFELTLAVSALSAGADPAIFYGYRAWGPNWPYDPAWQPGTATGFVADVDRYRHRFNPNKLLLDPYAREVSHGVQTPAQPDRAPYASGPATRSIDTAPFA